MRGGREVKRVSDQGRLVHHHILKAFGSHWRVFSWMEQWWGLCVGGRWVCVCPCPFLKKRSLLYGEGITLWRRNHSSHWSHVVQVRNNQILNWNDGFGNGWEIVFSGEVKELTCTGGERPWRASLVAQTVKNLPATQETRVQSLVRKDPLETGMATHSSILAWRIPWTEEPGGLQSTGSHNWATNT